MPGGEEWVNTYHFSGTIEVESSLIGDAFDAVEGFYTDLKTRLSDKWALESLAAANAPGPVLREDAVTGLVGEVTGVAVPNDCAVLVRWATAIPNRQGRGRTFLGGWPVSAVANGPGGVPQVDGGVVGGVRDAAASFLISTSFLVIYSRPAPTADPPRPAGHDSPVVTGSVSRRWATQRRRDLDTPDAPATF